MMEWLRKLTSEPVAVDLGWTQEDLDAYLFDPSTRLSLSERLLITPSLEEK